MSFKYLKLRRKVCIHYKSTEDSKYKFLTKEKKNSFSKRLKTNNDSKVALKKKKGQADQLTGPSSIQNVLEPWINGIKFNWLWTCMCWIYSAEYSTEHNKAKSIRHIRKIHYSSRIYFTFLTLWEIRHWESHQCLMIFLCDKLYQMTYFLKKYLQYLLT